jgi:GT2 family glycosyltransferase
MYATAVVVPNWNGADDLRSCLDSLRAQTVEAHIIVVDNGSVDDSVAIIEREYPEVEIIRHTYNQGYTGGVNPGFRHAIEKHLTYVAPFNNDAVADKDWLRNLVTFLDTNPDVGIAAAKVVSIDGKHLDSTGDQYTIWGLPYPRGRGETDTTKYDAMTSILGASGSSSLYRVNMLRTIGLLDQDFFAYYEDVDISLRAQLAGWKVRYVPTSVTYHQLNVTSRKIKGFFTYQTVKNYLLLFVKNVPSPLLGRMLPRFLLAYTLLIGRSIQRGNGWWALKALVKAGQLLPKKIAERRHIQTTSVVTPDYLWDIMTHDLPPNASNLRHLRTLWWRLRGKK